MLIIPIRQIIVHAPSPGVDSLIESCNAVRTMTKEIFSPTQGETIQIGQQTNSFSLSIPDELLASIKMSRVRFIISPRGSFRLTCFLSLRIMKLAM